MRVSYTHARGPNHKCDQLARALDGARDDIVVIADADVDLAEIDLDALVAPIWRDPRVAATNGGSRGTRRLASAAG